MKILNEWKYQIVFNNDKYIDVKNYSLLLSPTQKAHMDKQIEFFRKHYTFDQLLAKMQVLDERKQNILLNIALNNVSNLLYTPYCLKQYYLGRIREFPKYETILTELLTLSMRVSSRRNPSLYLVRDILGPYYGKVKRKVKQYSRRTMEHLALSAPLNEYDYLRQVHRLEKQIYDDKVTQGIFGKFVPLNTQFAYNNEMGLGEYRSSKICHRDNDLFVLNTCNNTINEHQLNHMVYLNMYPGYGHFINTIVTRGNSHCIDAGATFLLNGWSTFVAWHYNPSLYTRNSKILNSKVALTALHGNWGKNIQKLYIYLLGEMDKGQALEYIRMLTQYPTLIESYVLGALATEMTINHGFASSPWNLLQQLKQVDIGDFFWQYTAKNAPKKDK